jgi:cyclopropane fatty-acyl-phospholipid synthase-like methyltransferase
MHLQSIVNCPISDLGSLNPAFSKVFIPDSELGAIPQGVTSQFLENAQVYHDKYFVTKFTDWLLSNALKHVHFDTEAPAVLDIGSGSGQTVMSIINSIKNVQVLATDISPNLLAILQSMLAERKLQDRVATICLDLNKPWFHGQPFDLAVGKAILHHLFVPESLIVQVYTSVKPGGSMIFFEPFEPGNAMLAVILQHILNVSDRTPALNKHMRAFLTRRITVTKIMRCENKSVEDYANVDDKIMFTRTYFERIAATLKASVTIYPVNNVVNPFKESLTTTFRIALGKGPEVLPDWAWAIMAQAEERMSADCKADLLMTGCVIFTKPLSN